MNPHPGGNARMEHGAEELVIVCRSATERECAELALVLSARGIEHRFTPAPGGEWLLAVPGSRAREAAEELGAYRAERTRPVHAPRPVPQFRGAGIGAAAYAAVLMLVATLAAQYAFGFDWLAAGGLVAGGVLSGEWWRAVTALTLHVDTGHLASNVGFGVFFGYFIGRYFGPGVGWFAILCAGVSGNLLNALIQDATHRSIGASTAVFGALGLLTAHSWRRGLAHTSWRARLAPIAAGIGLLAFTGTGGENTDIFAHLTGFASGFGIGAMLDRIRPPRRTAVQAVFGAAALGVLALAWVAAFAGGG